MTSDHDLAASAARGDDAAFSQLVRRHEAAVRRFVARAAGQSDADDVAQEAFLTAWRHRGQWRGEASYRTWLFRIAWNVFLTCRRSAVRRAEREQDGGTRAMPATPQLDGLGIDLARALATLSESERAAVQLCLGEGFSHTEAAAILALPLGTVKSAVARGRDKLAKALGEQA